MWDRRRRHLSLSQSSTAETRRWPSAASVIPPGLPATGPRGPFRRTAQTVSVTFSPTAGGSYGGTVTVNTSNEIGTNTIAISGTGVMTATTAAVVSSGGTPFYGSKVTFTATVTPASGSGETGTVQFQIDGNNAGSPVSLSGNTATYATTARCRHSFHRGHLQRRRQVLQQHEQHNQPDCPQGDPDHHGQQQQQDLRHAIELRQHGVHAKRIGNS